MGSANSKEGEMRTIWFLAIDPKSQATGIRLDGFPKNHKWKPEVGKEFRDELPPCAGQKFVVVKVFTEAEAQFLEELHKIESIMRTDYFSDGLREILCQCVEALLETKKLSA